MIENLGRSHGNRLLAFQVGLRMADVAAGEEVLQTRARTAELAAASKRSHARQQERVNRRRDAYQRAFASLASLQAEKHRVPSEFSFVKGTTYLGLSLLLLLADFTLLGQVLARFLGLPWYTDDRNTTTFAQVFLRDPIQAYGMFPELLLLTVGVLILGMSGKLLRDTYLPVTTPSVANTRQRIEFWAAMVLCVLSLVLLIAVASVRFLFDASDDLVGMFPRGVSALIGIILPLLSAGFFIKGYDQLSSALALTGARVRLLFRDRFLSFAEHRLTVLDREGAGHSTRELAVNSNAFHQMVVSKFRGEYATGYQEGLTALMGGGTVGLYRRIQPALLRRAMTEDRS